MSELPTGTRHTFLKRVVTDVSLQGLSLLHINIYIRSLTLHLKLHTLMSAGFIYFMIYIHINRLFMYMNKLTLNLKP
jgi:uncharacterized integral membrane protein